MEPPPLSPLPLEETPEPPRRTGAAAAACLHGGEARGVRVEAVLDRGLSRVVLVGMPDQIAREARERLPRALESHGLAFPSGQVLFNLVPAQIPKRGLPLDLALAVALLRASGQAPRRPRPDFLFLGELDLEGRIGPPARGAFLAALRARDEGRTLVAAPAAAREASLVEGCEALACRHLGEVLQVLRDPGVRPAFRVPAGPRAAGPPEEEGLLEDVRGQVPARRAALAAACGGHPLLLQGPPGTGKSLLARRLRSLLPDLAPRTARELARTEALRGPLEALPRRPPLRAPHASVSLQALLGGGAPLLPGELPRAHGGVLFLDELPEFRREALEALRQPLEEGRVRIHRVRESAVFPARVLLVATRNPCPCGFATHPTIPCRCTPHAAERYRLRTSGPLLDRFHLFVEMAPVPAGILHGPPTSPTSAEARELLTRARALQEERRRAGGAGLPARASLEELQLAGLSRAARTLLRRATDRLALSARGSLRTLRVARTLADLAGQRTIQEEQILEALSLRPERAAEAAATG